MSYKNCFSFALYIFKIFFLNANDKNKTPMEINAEL